MPELSTGDEQRLAAAADGLVGAGRVLWAIGGPTKFRPVEDSQAIHEAREALDHGFPSDLMPRAWRAILDFGTMAVEHADSLASLLRFQRILSAPTLARATIEHAQRACWLLEPTHEGARTADARVTAVQRVARAQLEELFSSRNYRDTLEKLHKSNPQPETKEALSGARKDLKTLRSRLTETFGSESVVKGEPSEWRIAGQDLPVLTGLSEWYFRTMSRGSGLGVYDSLSSASHPTLWSIREQEDAQPTPEGGVDLGWVLDVGFAERLSATTCSTLYRMMAQMAGYSGWSVGPLHQWADTLNAWTPNLIVGAAS